MPQTVLDLPEFAQLSESQRRMTEEAYEWLFTSGVILSKIPLVMSSLNRLEIQPKEYQDRHLKNLPTILQHIIWLYNNAGGSS